ncbi:hypothetical protein HQ560_19410, partial [bacterium]|nr:hypothetical protein [bacterium]
MTKDELALMLRNAFTREGEWNFDAVADYDAEFWREWIAARLRGKDPWIPYERDEYPYTAYGLFLDYEQDARRAGISTAPCREGAAKFLESLDWLPSTEEPCHVLRNALILVGKLRAWAQESLDTLRALITDETLLKHGDDWRLELHRSALFALAAIQKRGDDTDHDLWMEWLEPWKDAVEAHKYDF